MSSTNRSSFRDSRVSDYYVTPISDICTFLREFSAVEPSVIYDSDIILDPTAGGDGVNPMSYPASLEIMGVDTKKVKTIDIREDSLAEIKGDYPSFTMTKVI